MYGYIYKITNKINGKIYVGQHKAETFDNRYWGSGSNLHEAKMEYGIDNFTREILVWCETLQELNQQEMFWIEHLQCRNPDIGYNIQPGGTQIRGYEQPPEVRRRLSEKAKGRPLGFWIHDDKSEKYHKGSEEDIPEGFVKGRLPANVKKSADSKRGQKVTDTSNLHRAKGKKWFTNGEKDTMAFECPEGFRPVRTNIPDNSGENNPMYGKPNPRKGMKNREESTQKLKNTLKELYKDLHRIWITDGNIETLHNVELPIPEGFTKGRIYRRNKN